MNGVRVFRRALETERRLNVRRVGWLSFAVISAFFALYLFLGVVLGITYWASIVRLFGIYWVLVAVLLSASLRSERVGRHAALSIALVHMPMIFFPASARMRAGGRSRRASRTGRPRRARGALRAGDAGGAGDHEPGAA